MNTHTRYGLTEYLVANGLLGGKVRVVDVGASGGPFAVWDAYGDAVQVIGFEPDPAECRRLNDTFSGRGHCFHPVSLSHEKARRTFTVTTCAGGNSLYPSDPRLMARLDGERFGFAPARSVEIETDTLDGFLDAQGIGEVDFLKVDTEGADLDVLKGACRTLEGVLGVHVEVRFIRNMQQPIFSEIDLYMRRQGFDLFDLELNRICRHGYALPYLRAHVVGERHCSGTARRGQPVWGDALYLRDAAARLLVGDDTGGVADSDSRILRLATFMELFDLRDCAAELIHAAMDRGMLGGLSRSALLDNLVLGEEGAPASYTAYMEETKRRNAAEIFARQDRGPSVVAIFGAGEAARRALGECREEGFQVRCMIDDASAGASIEGVAVVNWDAFVREHQESVDVIVAGEGQAGTCWDRPGNEREVLDLARYLHLRRNFIGFD